MTMSHSVESAVHVGTCYLHYREGRVESFPPKISRERRRGNASEYKVVSMNECMWREYEYDWLLPSGMPGRKD
jgi:hypothetical protein